MAKFHIQKNINGEYWWHLKANNGNIICWSEGYSTKQNAKESIEFTQVNAKDSLIQDDTI